MTENVVCLGGGSGQHGAAKALKPFASKNLIQLTHITTSADSGGENARQLSYLGLIPISDFVQILYALSQPRNITERVRRKMLNVRFGEEPLIGVRSSTSIYRSAVQTMKMFPEFLYHYDPNGNFQVAAIEYLKDEYNACGDILPITFEELTLVADYGDREVWPEHNIDVPKYDFQKETLIRNLYYLGPQVVYAPAIQALQNATQIIISMGDLYTSIGQILIFEEVAETIRESNAQVIMIANLADRPGQKTRIGEPDRLSDHIRLVEKWIGERGKVNKVIVNSHNIYDDPDFTDALESYFQQGQSLVLNDLDPDDERLVWADLVYRGETKQNPGDHMMRQREFRHDWNALSKVFGELFGIS